jgi:hypothetical protein
MLRRPSLRAAVTTVAAAVVLVGGAGLASYAATSHGPDARAAKASEPKTIVFHIGKPGKKVVGNATILKSAKVPKGTYEVGVSGFITETDSGATDSYSCVVADQKTIIRILRGHGTGLDFARVYALDGEAHGGFRFGAVNGFNPAQKIERPKIAVGCVFSGTGKFTISRTLTFTLKPVKVTNKSGTPIIVTKSETRALDQSLR